MSYQVLARKWRPRTFQDMVGQEHILRMLSNALEQKRLHHAYLFTGTRGVGKTTLARILAKCFNCETGITASPCGQCFACRAIDNGKFLDLYEVDAASRTKVEDTRDLLENVLYPPTQGRYKIYLIDEVHMLSNHSFNALLKTLEEPPEHVKFLLATTDPKKLPITILSRCLQFHLKRIMPDEITKHLQNICFSENIQFEQLALEKLAIAADGSMRDALSLLDQAIAYGRGTVNANEVHTMLGNVAQDDLMPILFALATKNGQQLFEITNHLATRAPDFSQVLDELANIFHQTALTQIVPNAVKVNEAITALAKQFSPEDVQIYYQIALLGKRDLQLTHPARSFEMTILRMLAFKPASETEKKITHSVPTPPNKPALDTVVPTFAEKKTDGHVTWRELLSKLALSGMAQALAVNCTLVKMTGNQVELALSTLHLPMLNEKSKERIQESLSQYLKQPIQLKINVTNEDLVTPSKQDQSEQEEQLKNAVQTIMQDPQVKKIIETYDATVEVSLLS